MLLPEDTEDGFTTHSSSFERIHNYEGEMEIQVRRINSNTSHVRVYGYTLLAKDCTSLLVH